MGRVYDTIFPSNKSLHTLFDTGAVHNYIVTKAAKGLPISQFSKPFVIGIEGRKRSINEACFIEEELQGNRLFCWALTVEELGQDE